MTRVTNKNELFMSSHLTLILSYTIFSLLLIGESLLMGWETWALFLVGGGVIISWGMHLKHDTPANVRIWIYASLMMFTFFFYGTHQTSTFDLAVVISAVIVLYTMTGKKGLITLCQFTYFVTMIYGLVMMGLSGEKFDALIISRSILHFCMVFFIGRFAKTIIDKWMQVLDQSEDEIEQLTDATERLNDFLANVSHEIRTPVNAIIGLTGICIEKTQNRGVQGDIVAVRDAGRKVAEQISDILDYSELDRKKAVRNNEDYMISSVLHDLITDIKQYKNKNVELIIDVDPGIPAVMNSDVAKIKKILKALISNGLKYTQQGGVYVRISTVEQEYGVNLCIEVTDTGIGMSDYELERIYESFYQADSGRTRMGGGLGLGLTIVQGFVSLLGGFMTISSKTDVGTTVNVSIPQKVIDSVSCMSVANPDTLCLGAFLHFEKYNNPAVRDYYNNMVLNIVKGLGVQMHRVNNAQNLKLLNETVHLTHLFVGEEEYNDNVELIEKLAHNMVVAVVANDDIVLPKNTRVRVLEKPFYCFPVVSVLNSNINDSEVSEKKLRCDGVRALVVDDESMNLVVAKSIFRRYGMKVETAMSGQESIDMCRDKVYDIIFMDHMMAGMDGVEAMKRIRTDVSGLNGSIPIVALTANAMSSAKQMFIAEGFDGFVSKPIEIEELERVMKLVLPKSSISFVSDEEPLEITDDPVPDEDGPSEEINETADPFDNLRAFGLDTAAGLKYSVDDKEFYQSLLIQYAKESDEKMASIKQYYDLHDWHNYEIYVHALKSTSKMIGAMELSEKAKNLEFAAKKSDAEYIALNHSAMIADYMRTVNKIKSEFGIDSGDEDDEIFEFSPDDGDSVGGEKL